MKLYVTGVRLSSATVLMFCLGMIASLSVSAEDGGAPKTGFYRVIGGMPASHPFGPVLFLSSDTVLNPTRGRWGTPERGLRGRFGVGGRIWTEFHGRPGKPRVRWKAAGSYGSLWMSSDESTASARISFAGSIGSGRLELGYLGRDEREVALKLADHGLGGFEPSGITYISHRGISYAETTNETGIYPANTLPAFEHAIEQGYAGFELDVHVSSDGHMIVSHDEDLSVSTDCTGKIGELTLSQMSQCHVRKSGLLPESGFASDWARLSAKLPTLREALLRFLPKPEVKTIVVDVKPGHYFLVSRALNRAAGGFTAEEKAKIVYLMRDEQIARRLHRGSYSKAALEGETGWEPLDPEARTQFTHSNATDSISISLGLGLGLGGPSVFEKISNVVTGLPGAAFRLDLDIGYVNWSESNQKRLEELRAEARRLGKPLIAWTVNGMRKNRVLRERFRDLEYVLSDSPYEEIAALQIEEMITRRR